MYNKGDIVYWLGVKPVYGVILEPSGERWPNRWVVRVPGYGPNKFDACHEEYLRFATDYEIKQFNEEHPNFVEEPIQIIRFDESKIKLF